MEFDYIILCGGKCGSSTLYNSFIQMGFNALHLHGQSTFDLVYSNVQKESGIKDLKKFILSQKKKCYIIDVYRDPIERAMSSFFQNFKESFPDYEKIDNLFFMKYITHLERYHPLDDMFPELVQNIDFENKYIRVDKDNLTFVKLKFDDINSWGEILSEITGMNVKMIPDNLSENKDYIELYKQFKKDFIISESDFYSITHNYEFMKYKNGKERQEYFNKWRNKIISDEEMDNKFLTVKRNRTPNDFRPSVYKKINKDLSSLSDGLAMFHYEIFGYKENRQYKFVNLPEDFDCDIYRNNNIDLKNMTDEQLITHYLTFGCKENRIYK